MKSFFKHKRRRHTIVARDPGKPNFVSVNPITKDYDQKHPLYAKKFPKGLPPKRTQDFKIALKEDAVQHKKGLYRMSSAELDELKTQLTELVDQGFLRPSTSLGEHLSVRH